MADPGFGEQLALAGFAGVLTLSGVVASARLSSRSKREDDAKQYLREQRATQLQAYQDYLTAATEFDETLSFCTPSAGQIGQMKIRDEVIEATKLAGEPVTDLGSRPPLIAPSKTDELKQLLVRATAGAARAQIVGSTEAAGAARNLQRAQRRWLLALEADDPPRAGMALGEARPMLAELERVFARLFNDVTRGHLRGRRLVQTTCSAFDMPCIPMRQTQPFDGLDQRVGQLSGPAFGPS